MKNKAYDFKEFKIACRGRKSIILFTNVEDDAENQFNLRGKNAILDFIVNNSFEYNDTEEFKNEGRFKGILIDSYKFKTGPKIGYLAFLKTFNGLKWIIKSFHYAHEMTIGKLFDSKSAKDALKAIGHQKRLINKKRK